METSEYTFKNLYDLEKKNTSFCSPLAVIAHIDLDAFYAQCEQVRLGLKLTDPVVCRQWNGLIAIGYGARKYGISRHENVISAKEKCPNIIFAHVATFKMGEVDWKYHENPDPQTHKVSLDPYRRESRKILSIFRSHCSIIEKASIDESFLDLGKLVLQKVLELFPELVVNEVGFDMERKLPKPPKLAHFPERYSWRNNGVIIPTKIIAKDISTEEIKSDMESIVSDNLPTEHLQGPISDVGISIPDSSENDEVTPVDDDDDLEIDDWDDVLILLASTIVTTIRKEVFDKLGYTCSAGIGRVRTIAKLASGLNKPDNQTVVRNRAIEAFMSNFEATDIPGLGGKKGTNITKILNLPENGSISILRQFTLPEFEEKLHDAAAALKLYNTLRGLDYGEINTRVDIKSMQSSKQFRPGINDNATAIKWLKVYSAELAARINELEEETGIKRRPRVLRINHRQFQPTLIQRSKQMPIPDVAKDKLQEMLFVHGCQLLKELEEESLSTSYGNITIYPAVLLSLGLSNFDGPGENGKRIRDFFTQISDEKQRSNLKKELEKLPVGPLPLVSEKLSIDDKPRIGLDRYLSVRTTHESKSPERKVDTESAVIKEYTPGGLNRYLTTRGQLKSPPEKEIETEVDGTNDEGNYYPCEKCGKDVYIGDVPEHFDWHFAKDIAQEDRRTVSTPIALLPSPSILAKAQSAKKKSNAKDGGEIGSGSASAKKRVKLDKGQMTLKF